MLIGSQDIIVFYSYKLFLSGVILFKSILPLKGIMQMTARNLSMETIFTLLGFTD
jgi:hypothetical protein